MVNTRQKKKKESKATASNRELDVMDNFYELQNNIQFNFVLKEICSLPFHAIYWIPEQLQDWKDSSRYNDPQTFLTTTNHFIENYNKNSHNYLYSLMSIKNDNLISHAEAISESRNYEFVDYFICEWLRIGKIPNPPKKLMTLLSHELLEGALMSFNVCSLQDYNLECF